MTNKQLVKNTIHDPRPIKSLVTKHDYQLLDNDEYPVAEIILPENIDLEIQNGVLTIIVDTDGAVKSHQHCLFDKPLFDIIRHIDSFGVSAKLLTAKHGLYPAVFVSDVKQNTVLQVAVDSQPFDLSQVIADNCFYARNLLTDISRRVLLAQEQFAGNMLDCKYVKHVGDDVFTERHYSDGTVQLLIGVRVKRLYLCVKKVKFLPFHTVQETCFEESSSVRKAAIAYNAKVRNANK